MNIIAGKITQIISSGSLSKVEVEAGQIRFKTIVIDTEHTSDYLALNREVKILFNETEVGIGLGDLSNISLQNRVSGTIKKLELGDLQAKVVLDTVLGDIKSIITVDAVKQLDLKEGIEATALIKTNEIMLTD